jgi:type IX secretion system PorP/SprF family membrane protein
MKTIYTFIFLLFGMGLYAQQQAVYSNFLMSDYYYNPAIAGSKNVHVANINYRNQWTGFDDAPVNFSGNFSGSFKNRGKAGYGATIISEKSGLTSTTGIYLNYAHHFKLSNKVKLGFGIQPGYIQYRVRLYDAIVADQGDEIATGSVYAANAIDVNTGFHLYSKKFFLMGSVQHLLGKQIQFTSYNSNLAFHYNAIAGYNFTFKKKKFELQPSVMVKYTSPVPVQYTGMLKGTFNSKYWVGLIYRSDDAVGVSLGMWIKERMNIAYGFDYSVSGIRKYNSGSHEVMLSFIITKKRPTLDEQDEKLNNSILEEMKKQEEEKKKSN